MKTVAIGIKSEFDLIKLSVAVSSFLAICQTFKHENTNISGKAGLLYNNILAVYSNLFARQQKGVATIKAATPVITTGQLPSDGKYRHYL